MDSQALLCLYYDIKTWMCILVTWFHEMMTHRLLSFHWVGSSIKPNCETHSLVCESQQALHINTDTIHSQSEKKKGKWKDSWLQYLYIQKDLFYPYEEEILSNVHKLGSHTFVVIILWVFKCFIHKAVISWVIKSAFQVSICVCVHVHSSIFAGMCTYAFMEQEKKKSDK